MTSIERKAVVRAHGVTFAVALSTLLALGCGANGEGYGGESDSESTPSDSFSEPKQRPAGAALGRAREPESPPESGDLEERSNSVLRFRWTKGEPQKVLVSASTHICGLSMVRGQLHTSTSLMVLRQNGNWVLRGLNPGGNTLQAEAVCEPFSAFRVNSGSASNAGDFVASTTSKNVTRSASLPSRTAAVLTGLVGRFEGGGERARVLFGSPHTVEIKNGGQDGTHSAFASALSFGPTANQFPRFNSYFTDGFVVSDGKTVSWSPNAVIVGCIGDVLCCESDYVCPEKVAPVASAFCYLSSVSGDFNGADEWVQVVPDRTSGHWTIAMESESGNGLTARVSCLDMDQRTGGGVIH
jgi:hypothetical protein